MGIIISTTKRCLKFNQVEGRIVQLIKAKLVLKDVYHGVLHKSTVEMQIWL